MIAALALGALFFGLAAYGGSLAGLSYAQRVAPLPDAPAGQRAPVALIVAFAAILGAFEASHAFSYGFSPAALPLQALVCAALAAVCVTDFRRGIVPDVFSLGALVVVLAVCAAQHQWWALLSAGAVAVPFAFFAALTRGRGLGWGDVKLAALGGAVLGAQLAIAAFALACFAAAAWSYARRKQHEPVAFAPYLAAAIGAAIPLGILH